MVPKSRLPINKYTKHFTDQQRLDFYDDIFELIEQQSGLPVAAIKDTNIKKSRECAEEFLLSDISKKYWPLSDGLQGQWQYEFSEQEAQYFVAEWMVKESKARVTENPTLLVDFDAPEVAPKVAEPKSPRKTKVRTPAKNSEAIANPVALVPGPIELQDVSSPAKGVSKSAYAAYAARNIPSQNPLFPRDIPHDDPPELPLPPSPKSIRPTPNSHRIASERSVNHNQASASPQTITDDEIETTASFNKQVVKERRGPGSFTTLSTPSQRQKRRFDDPTGDGLLTPSPISPPERPMKKVAFDVVSSIELNKNISEQGDQQTMSTPVETSVPDPQQPAQAPTNPPFASEPLVSACGLQFKLQDFVQIPQRLLDYITDCQYQNSRSEQEAMDENTRIHFHFRSSFFNDLRADIESRINFLAVDTRGRERVELSYCMWNSKPYQRGAQ